MEDYYIKKITFQQRPISIPADYRPIYKIAQLVLILKITCRGGRASLMKLHLLAWALSSKSNMYKLDEYLYNDFNGAFSVWGFDPALNRAIQLAVGEKICEVIDGRNYKLTPKGEEFYTLLMEDKELFELEKAALVNIGKSITEAKISTITDNWTIFYA